MLKTISTLRNSIRKGFTFLEVLIATSIFAIVAGGIALFSFYYFQSYTFANEQNQQLFDAQSGLATMLKEIRSARQSEQGAWPLVEPNDQSLTFYSDVTGDGRADKVRYFVQNKILKKGVIQPTTTAPIDYPSVQEVVRTIATNVDMTGNTMFMYYNGNWPSDTVSNPLSLANRQLSTRYIVIAIRIDQSTNTKTVQPLILTAGVHIRSLKDNL